MPSFAKLTGALFRDKVRAVHMVVGIEIIGTIVSIILMFISNSKGSMTDSILATTLGIVMLAAGIMFLVLAIRQERVWTKNFYRLIPVSDAKLYLANVLSVVCNYIYFGILQLILLLVFNIGSWHYFKYMKELTPSLYGVIFSTLLILVVTTLFFWIFISLIHLIVEALSSFLPTLHERLYRIVLYVVVFYVVIKVISYISGMVVKVVSSVFSFNMTHADAMSTAAGSMLVASGYMAVAIILLSFINVFILNKWVETNPQST